MFEKKQNNFSTPDMSQLKAVVIDKRTRIYVPFDVDPEVACARYWSHREAKNPGTLSSK
ncbi:MAG: hypothetical protein AAGU19_19920 [Prolixibacteraceae bacterium]